ncbi:hypothetical protein MIND_01198200 [Mycena indigotica]|uniref:SHSP domain-containing protein n=1 Tax=Mycena indigotica TaxID=2126181 RepID=A0A8H6VYP3_9AGAR|nr:uncharacterized protein MIND_01198200 [Mycena indigotica]KAF7292989.1 hypothetical protein MIND_01198200 [Mycena indigotica]
MQSRLLPSSSRAGRDMQSLLNPLRSHNSRNTTSDLSPKPPKKAASFRALSVCENRPPLSGPFFPCGSTYLSVTFPPDSHQNQPARADSTRRISSRIRSSLSKPHAKPSPLARDTSTSTPTPTHSDDYLTPQPSAVAWPIVSMLPRPKTRRNSITARSRRTPSLSQYPPLLVNSSQTSYTIKICLPTTIAAEMVTICTLKGDKLRVVADAWHLESDCHYEWEIGFPPREVDMSSICAKVEETGLVIRASRLDTT